MGQTFESGRKLINKEYAAGLQEIMLKKAMPKSNNKILESMRNKITEEKNTELENLEKLFEKYGENTSAMEALNIYNEFPCYTVATETEAFEVIKDAIFKKISVHISFYCACKIGKNCTIQDNRGIRVNELPRLTEVVTYEGQLYEMKIGEGYILPSRLALEGSSLFIQNI
ncbi:hypothetical protein KPL26_02985 [Clostridium algidicarnis]|uniref:hypothetical protein n=1 Tax=Clostridium algidicarnis TaxID=37659 RepID=UPI001C0CED1C|nr:hypothetical protein [Clostridium algidicarnis]MBU3195629.1 hypothetical protein [Clostridium algidicarnis]